ncbi:MAG: hypothetical protein ACT4OG_08405 [Alphaproteobacteria bacterium]
MRATFARFAVCSVIVVTAFAFSPTNAGQQPAPAMTEAAGQKSPAPDFQQMTRELQMLSSEVRGVMRKLERDPALREKIEAAAKSGDFRAGEAELRKLVGSQYEVHVMRPDSPAAKVKVTICINPKKKEINIVIEW